MACHGPNGRGNPAANYPSIAGQYAVYTAKQLRDYASGARKTDGPTKVMRDIASRSVFEHPGVILSAPGASSLEKSRKSLPGFFDARTFQGRKELHASAPIEMPLSVLQRARGLPAFQFVCLAEQDLQRQLHGLSQFQHSPIALQQTTPRIDDNEQAAQTLTRFEVTRDEAAPVVADRARHFRESVAGQVDQAHGIAQFEEVDELCPPWGLARLRKLAAIHYAVDRAGFPCIRAA